jgi:SWI/SNF-related matrix-associated actin-dependent regulator of chromatin subfamily A3
MESPGGILADYMGMGKSLSTLALITRSREVAAEWAKGELDRTTSYESCLPSRATLIIVPTLSE